MSARAAKCRPNRLFSAGCVDFAGLLRLKWGRFDDVRLSRVTVEEGREEFEGSVQLLGKN